MLRYSEEEKMWRGVGCSSDTLKKEVVWSVLVS